MAVAKKAKPREEKATFFVPGEFVRFTFIRLYKAKTGASDIEAETVFNLQLSIGRIIIERRTGFCGDIAVYKFK